MNKNTILVWQIFQYFFFTLGKASRMLAAKAALACRADALFESLEANNKDKDVKFDPEWIEQRERMNKGELGLEGRTKVETRIRILEGGHSLQVHRQFESFILKRLFWDIDKFVSYVLHTRKPQS